MRTEMRLTLFAMTTKVFSLTFLGYLLLAYGCRRQSLSVNIPIGHQDSKIYSETELEKLITRGMSAEDVIKNFGKAGSVVEFNPDESVLIYSFPIQPQKTAMHLGGFKIHIKNGVVLEWSPIMQESRQSFPGSGNKSSSE